METKIEKITTTFLYDVEHEGKSYKLVQEQDHILDKLECTLFDMDGEVQSDELVDKIFSLYE